MDGFAKLTATLVSELGCHVGIHFKRGFNLAFNAWLSDAPPPLQDIFLAMPLLACLYLYLETIRRIRGFLSSKTQSNFRNNAYRSSVIVHHSRKCWRRLMSQRFISCQTSGTFLSCLPRLCICRTIQTRLWIFLLVIIIYLT